MWQAVTVFDSMMKEVMDQAGGLSSQNTELCSLLRNILQVHFLFHFLNWEMSVSAVFLQT